MLSFILETVLPFDVNGDINNTTNGIPIHSVFNKLLVLQLYAKTQKLAFQVRLLYTTQKKNDIIKHHTQYRLSVHTKNKTLKVRDSMA